MSSFWIKAKSNKHYKLLTRLSVPSRSVHALAISNDGQVLACGGTEGVKLWDINSRKELACSSHHHESQGTVSCAAWTLTRPTTVETLCYGTGLGYIVFLRRSVIDKRFQEICVRMLGSGFEITCLSWDSTSSEANTRIAVGMRDKIVQVLLLNTNSQLQSVFAVRLDNTVPKSVAFADNYDIYVFGLYDGKFIKLEGKDGTVVREFSCQSVIGHAAVNLKRGIFVVDNVTDGFTMYCLEDEGEEPVRTFTTAVPSMSVPKQVAFGEEGRVVAGGSDNGLVYVFDRKAGELLETLHHANGGLVQTIVTRDLNGRCTITSISPAQGRGNTTIKLWTYDYAPRKASKTPSKDYWWLWHMLMILTQVLILLSTSIFLAANYKGGFIDRAVTWSVDHIHQYMTPPPMAKVADDFSRRAINEYLNMECRKERHTKNDIDILSELAGKLMELAIEAGGDLDDQEHPEQ
ncbi:WD40-repeat-containing domain protein [Suillus occidentalis]|nr:WD40-repeat-containing domain protein [Suillus occidentalis]